MKLKVFSPLRVNAVANMTGRVWSAALNLLAIPLVVKILGIDAYGLVSFAMLFTALVAFLDFGLAATINREVARLRSLAQQETIPALLRTFEIIYWAAAAIICGVLACVSWFFSEHWLNSTVFTVNEMRNVLLVAAFSLAIRWPTALYSGFLQGCEKQVLGNSVQMATNAFRTGGGLVIIYFFSPTVTAYLWWQVAASIVEVAVNCHFARKLAWGISHAKSVFSYSIIRSTWRFSLSYCAVGVIGMVVSSSDRFILAKFLPISQLGEYSMASTVVGILPLIGLSIGNALFPVLSGHHAKGDTGMMWKHLSKAIKVTSIAIFGLLFLIMLFGNDILHLWTRQENLSIYKTPVLALLALAAFFSALNVLLGTALTSAGINDAAIKGNLVSLAIQLPLNVICIPAFGMAAAALMACLQQGGLVLYLTYRVKKCVGFKHNDMTGLLKTLRPYAMVAFGGTLGFHFMTRGCGYLLSFCLIGGSVSLYYTFVLWKNFLMPHRYHDV